jgi:Acetyltransferase (GNAT) domain
VDRPAGTLDRRTPAAGYEVVTPAPRAPWRAAFLADPHAQAFHSPEWLDGVCAAGGYEDASRLYAAPDGRLLVLPMVRRTHLGGRVGSQASMPASYGVGGVLSRDAPTPADLTAICADLRGQRGVLRTFIRPASRTAGTWAAADLPAVKSTPRLGHVLDLEGGFEHIWERGFRKSVRRTVRRAERAGVVVEHDTTGARLPEYFLLVEDSVQRWAKQQHEPLLLSRWRARQRMTLERMQRLAAAVPGRFHLYLGVLDGRVVAGNVVYHATGARATSSAMIKDLAGPVGAMHLLDRVAIADACAAGCTHYDLGESGANDGLALYKTGLGAVPQAYRSFVIERLPLTELDHSLRQAVKRAIGFREPPELPSDPAGSAGAPGTRAS